MQTPSKIWSRNSQDSPAIQRNSQSQVFPEGFPQNLAVITTQQHHAVHRSSSKNVDNNTP
ncbi:hypothetical protein Goshw_006630 [Gossypium schwendimanii]|uniref:Uncharacterized protein n=1 Tax=Gossypium schwendimanii TaxID=34291 RepID=A0A7J9MAE6_GOSSC|nr:hypothetical protein [Gossypium schwendimanii]